MRGILASSIGVTCATALALPLALPSGAQAATASPPSDPVSRARGAEPVSSGLTSPGLTAPGVTSSGLTSSGLTAERPAVPLPGLGPAAAVPGGPGLVGSGDRGRNPAGPVALGRAAARAAGDPAAGLPSVDAQPPSVSEESIPGSTQSLPLAPLPSARSFGPRARSLGFAAGSFASLAAAQGLPERDVRRFSLVGVVWDDPGTELHGRVQVRTRATGTATWSDWQGLETHNLEHAADAGSAERASRRVRGSTAPLWVGDSDGVEVRVIPEAPGDGRDAARGRALPEGLHLELVDPGDESSAGPARAAGPQAAPADEHLPQGALNEEPPVEDAPDSRRLPSLLDAPHSRSAAREPESPGAPGSPATGRGATRHVPLTPEQTRSASANADLAPLGADVIKALSRTQTRDGLIAARGKAGAAGVNPYIGPRPRIIARKGWRADERLRERTFLYTKTVQAAFVHHTATGNNYRCSQVASLIRSIYRYHVKSNGWRDIGYNFLVDKCGNIYEGRAGGVAKPVMGAHTLGFNTNSMGIAVLGTFTDSKPPAAAVTAVARLTAWKLGLSGANPSGSTVLTSGGSNKYKKGRKVRLRVISGHRDGFLTECPGAALYRQLTRLRVASARYQGR